MCQEIHVSHRKIALWKRVYFFPPASWSQTPNRNHETRTWIKIIFFWHEYHFCIKPASSLSDEERASLWLPWCAGNSVWFMSQWELQTVAQLRVATHRWAQHCRKGILVLWTDGLEWRRTRSSRTSVLRAGTVTSWPIKTTFLLCGPWDWMWSLFFFFKPVSVDSPGIPTSLEHGYCIIRILSIASGCKGWFIVHQPNVWLVSVGSYFSNIN